MARRIARTVLMVVLPVVPTLLLAVATTDSDEGANIGGGLMVMAGLIVGLALGVRAWAGSVSGRALAIGAAVLIVLFALTYGLDSLESS